MTMGALAWRPTRDKDPYALAIGAHLLLGGFPPAPSYHNHYSKLRPKETLAKVLRPQESLAKVVKPMLVCVGLDVFFMHENDSPFSMTSTNGLLFD